MADKSENALDKAEVAARRILERLGSKLESKLAPSSQQTLGARQISDLTTRVERAIESNLQQTGTGEANLAPNQFQVLLTYEETSNLSTEYMEAMGKELTNTVHEYINNRRYKTSGPIVVEVSRDLFSKTTLVKAEFSGKPPESSDKETGASAQSTNLIVTATLVLADAGGHVYRVAVSSNATPACIGRAAGNALRIDDGSISRIHCSLAIRSSGEVLVADLESANGTFVNDARVSPNETRKLTPGDVIRLGDVAFTVSSIV